MITPQEQVSLAPLTTFTIGGSARYFVDVYTEEEIIESVQWARSRKIPRAILAGGSNVLIADEGFGGLVMRIEGGRRHIRDGVFVADAGCNLWGSINEALKLGLGGWERLAGIPGTIGGAVRGNAGAFGTEIQDVLVWAEALETGTGETRTFQNEECGFRYRHSFFKEHPEWLILRAAFRLAPMERKEGERIAAETVAERQRRHIQDVCAAGSFFMNPVAPKEIQVLFEKEKNVASKEGRVPAGWLIEKVGLKGATVGGAKASEMHPNYLINAGDATARDVLALAERIKEKVRSEFGVDLQEEVTIVT